MMVLRIIRIFESVAIVIKRQILKMCFCKCNRTTEGVIIKMQSVGPSAKEFNPNL